MTDSDFFDAHPRRLSFLRAARPEEDCSLVLVSRINRGLWWRRLRRVTDTAASFQSSPTRATEDDCRQILAETRTVKPGYRWRKHLGPKPSPQHTIDRIDNNGGYRPRNARVA